MFQSIKVVIYQKQSQSSQKVNYIRNKNVLLSEGAVYRVLSTTFPEGEGW